VENLELATQVLWAIQVQKVRLEMRVYQGREVLMVGRGLVACLAIVGWMDWTV